MKVRLQAPTATGSFSSSRGRLNFRSNDGCPGSGKHGRVRPSVLATISTLFVVGLLASCGSLERRHVPGETSGPPPTGAGSQIGSVNGNPVYSPAYPGAQPSTSSAAAQNPSPSQVAVPGPGPVPAPPVVPQAPTFLSKELPKVGLILGPGGMKAFAHIGVLKELARARVPIHAVTGLEWGAVVGGLFAMQGQANDAEWKSFKLRESDLPSGGFLSSRTKPQSVASLNEFLETAFGSAAIDKSRIEFACPAYWSKADRFGWMAKGAYKDALRACLPYPPLYTDNAGVVASPFSVGEAVTWLRAHGANLIVLVDVLSQGDTLPVKMAGDDLAEGLLWSEIRREMQRSRPLVNHVILVNTGGHPVSDFAGRRALMDAGAKAAADVVNRMVTQYGF